MKPNVERERMFAEIAHAGQPYADEVPYTHHLGEVVKILQKYHFDDDVMICAGWLHDCIEDTNKSFNDIAKRFGEDVAELVFCVTNELGRNRKERNSKTYPKIKGNPRAVALKLADRIANVEYSLANGGKDQMYRTEFAEFEKAIRAPDRINEDSQISRMWLHLGRLLQATTA